MSSKKLPVNNFECIENNEYFIKNYNEENDKGNFLEVNVQYTEKLNEIHNDLPFLPKKLKIEKIGKLVANLHDETEYVIHIRYVNQALNYGLVLRKVRRVIEFNQNAWLKPYTDVYTDLKKKQKTILKKIFF